MIIRGISQEQLDRLIDALIAVESSGNDNAIGDGGKAYGCLQIHQCVLDEYNQWHGDVEEDAWIRLEDLLGNRQLSRDLCQWYLHKWAYRAWLNHGVNPTLETLARIWNGGPNGYAKRATLPHWEKVRAQLERPR